MKKQFGLRLKLVLFVSILALITYSVSFIFIEFLQPTSSLTQIEKFLK